MESRRETSQQTSPASVSTLLLTPLLMLIRAYQYCVSPLLGPRCRFHPSCSHYAVEAIQQHGLVGLWLSVRRLCRCHPWHPGGHDPVPSKCNQSRSHT